MCTCVDCWLAIVSWVGDEGGAVALDWGSGLDPLKSNTQNNTLLKDKKKDKKINKLYMLGNGLSQVDDVVYLYSLHCAKPTKQWGVC